MRHIFEDELNIRTSRGVNPTPRAEALAKPTREIIDAARGLLVQEKFDPSKAAFSVSLCGTDYIQNTIFTEHAVDIMGAVPNAKVSIQSRPVGNLESQLSRGEFDFVVSNQYMLIPGMPVLPLFGDHVVCISSYSSHSEGQFSPLDELCALRHVVLTQPQSGRCKRSTTTGSSTVTHETSFWMSELFCRISSHGTYRLYRLHTQVPRAAITKPFQVSEGPYANPVTDICAICHPRLINDARHIWLRETLGQTVEGFLSRQNSEA